MSIRSKKKLEIRLSKLNGFQNAQVELEQYATPAHIAADWIWFMAMQGEVAGKKILDADFFIVHARHGKERDKDPADFSVYEECVQTGKKIIANGDIKTKEQIEYLKSIGIKGAMIGREALDNPQIFNQLKN